MSNDPFTEEVHKRDLDHCTIVEGESTVESNSSKKIKLDPTTNPQEQPIEQRTQDSEAEGMWWRLRLKNLPKFTDPKSLKKYLSKVGIENVKLNKAPKWDYAFLTFQNEQEQKVAIEKLKDAVMKKNTLQVEVANMSAEERAATFDKRATKKHAELEADTRTPSEKLADQVTPLHKLSYEDQIQQKTKSIHKVLSEFRKKISALTTNDENTREFLAWANGKSEFGQNLPCEVLPTVASPETNFYRTKCEFTFGRNLAGDKTVGFLLGLFRDGLTTVLSPEECLHVSEPAKKLARMMEEYVRASEYDVYDRVTKQGTWRTMLVRTQRTGEVMVIVQFSSQGMSEQQISEEKEKLKKYFQSDAESDKVKVSTLLIQIWDGLSNGMTDKAPLETLFGPGYVHEELLGFKFQISPTAFFQVNTPATECLYSIVRDWCALNANGTEVNKTTLLDLCCGTGTIGITMAKSVEKVIGIELCREAVEDARMNAKLNGLENTEYICSKVEDALHMVKRFKDSDSVVAVLDPPRSGVHQSVLKAVRSCSALKRIIYVSCDANQALSNFISLCRPTSNNWEGNPFKPKRAVPVDLFPLTKHCELIIEFERQ
ncbi:uncharacterized protein VTP21DRAFT_4625 [Calcarisporiella thermophila]|uniref:uncharacterized protein n=1 Tax=Calcarisporiella thermophila TaxID=911321 RepID=UPI00374282E8